MYKKDLEDKEFIIPEELRKTVDAGVKEADDDKRISFAKQLIDLLAKYE